MKEYNINKTIELNEVDIIHKYTMDQKHELQSMGEILISNSSSMPDNIEFVKGDKLIFDEEDENDEVDEEDKNSSTTESSDSDSENSDIDSKLNKQDMRRLNTISDKRAKESIKIMRNRQIESYNLDDFDINSI